MYRRRLSNALPTGTPAWMVTYADLMSLLLAFFIMLAAYSTINEQKLLDALGSFQQVLGVVPASSSGGGGDAGKVAREMQRKAQVLGKAQAVRVTFNPAGNVVLTFAARALFDGDGAVLREDANDLMQAVVDALKTSPECRLTVKGHSDDRPLPADAGFRDASDWTYARADAVARRLEAIGKLPIDRFEIVACGAGQPRAVNSSDEGREANRRIEIVVSGAGRRSTMDVEEGMKRVEQRAQGAP